MDEKVKNDDGFVVDEMIKNYWNVLCARQKFSCKTPENINSRNDFYKGCVAGFIVFWILFGVIYFII